VSTVETDGVGIMANIPKIHWVHENIGGEICVVATAGLHHLATAGGLFLTEAFL